jgi:DNA-binding NarL/FixJ family response regulator
VDKRRILVIVEDEVDVRWLIKMTLLDDPRLELIGEAASAAEAIEVARVNQPGLIVLDHSIEGDVMGLEAAPMLREVAPGAKILMFSAFDLAAEAEQEPAIDAFLLKTRIDILLPTVQGLLGLAPLDSD